MDPIEPTPPVPSPTPPQAVPAKYIRTFAGDMETFQKGGIPDLAPFTPADEPIVVPEEGVVVPTPTPEAPAPEVVAEQTPTERLVAPSPVVPEPLEVPLLSPPEPPASAPSHNEPVVAPLKTYAGDFTTQVSTAEASTATILAAEQDAKKGSPVVEEAPKKGNVWLVVGGVVLLLLAVGVAVFAYIQYKKANAPVVVAPLEQAPITVEERATVRGEGAELLAAITESLATPPPTGSIRFLFSESTTTTESLFTLLNLGAPSQLTRNVMKEGSMVGIIEPASTPSVFFILNVASYPETFAAMLSWEPSMLRDLAPLFGAYPEPIVPAPVVATSTATTSPKAAAPKAKTTASTMPVIVPKPKMLTFRDETLQNHDVRVYRDEAGRVVIVYGYWDRTTLIIARDLTVYTELLGRLSTSRPTTP